MLSALEVSQHLQAKLVGVNQPLSFWQDLVEPRQGGVAMIKSPRDLDLLPITKAAAVIGPIELLAYQSLLTHHPYLRTFFIVDALPIEKINDLLRYYKVNTYQLDNQSNTSQDANIYIGQNVKIGANCFFMPGVKIMNCVTIGDNVAIHANTVIKEGTVIGNNVIIDSNCSIGNYAFEYFWQADQYQRIESVGQVIIEDDVEIGANNTIDRGTFGVTRIGKGTKIDNQVQIGHDVKIGQNCLIISQVGIAGWAIIENNVILHGQVGVAGHVTVGAGTLVKAQAGITKSCEPNSQLAGYPAVNARVFWKKQAWLDKAMTQSEQKRTR